jgi:hypothetical protein
VPGWSAASSGAQELVVQLDVKDRDFQSVGGQDVAVGVLDPRHGRSRNEDQNPQPELGERPLR